MDYDLKAITEKFGASYRVTPALFKMGIRKIFGEHIASRFAGRTRVLDACVGGGFNAIPLAHTVKKIVAVDINREHLDYAEQNAAAASITNISFIHGDIMDGTILQKIGEIDGAYLDPEWVKGGCSGDPEKCDFHAVLLADTFPRADQLLEKIGTRTRNIALRLSRKFQLEELARYPNVEIEASYLNARLQFYTIYFGDLRQKVGFTEFRVIS